jgi:hypothetical protein
MTCHEDGIRSSIELRGAQGGTLRKDFRCEAAVERELKVCLAGYRLLTGRKASVAGAAAVTAKQKNDMRVQLGSSTLRLAVEKVAV